MPSLTGLISFTVKFDLTGTPSLKIQPSTTIPSGNQPTLTGYFNILQPDGIQRTGSYTSPDIVWNGSGYNEVSVPLRLATDGTYQKGDYIITMIADEPDYTPGEFARSFTMTYSKISQSIVSSLDVFTPLLSYSDATVYTQNNFSITSQTSSWTATSLAGTITPSSTSTFNLAIGGSYYDAAYSVNYSKVVDYLHSNTWLSVKEGWSFSEVADAYTPSSMVTLLGWLDALKAERDAAYCNTALEETYEKAATLYVHIRSKVCALQTTGLKEYFDEFYRLTHNYQNLSAAHTNAVIPAYDFTTGCGGGSGSSGTTIIIECVIGNAYTISGSNATVTGLTDGSTSISCADFANVRVEVIRGNVPQPNTNPLDGSSYITKILSGTTITLSTGLVTSEYIKIKTIPS